MKLVKVLDEWVNPDHVISVWVKTVTIDEMVLHYVVIRIIERLVIYGPKSEVKDYAILEMDAVANTINEETKWKIVNLWCGCSVTPNHPAVEKGSCPTHGIDVS